MEVLFNTLPGTLINRSSSGESTYESVCITIYSEDEIKSIVKKPFIAVPSNNEHERLVFLGSTIRYINYGGFLTDGSDMIFRLGSVLTSGPVPATEFLGTSKTIQVPTTNPPEQVSGIPITVNANAEYEFEEGDGSSAMYIITTYMRIINER